MQHFQMTPQQKAELSRGGRHTRVYQAVQHLSAAGLIAPPKGTVHTITERGRQFLSRFKRDIMFRDLTVFPEYAEWQAKVSARMGAPRTLKNNRATARQANQTLSSRPSRPTANPAKTPRKSGPNSARKAPVTDATPAPPTRGASPSSARKLFAPRSQGPKATPNMGPQKPKPARPAKRNFTAPKPERANDDQSHPTSRHRRTKPRPGNKS